MKVLDNKSFLQNIGRSGRSNSTEVITFDQYFSRVVNDPKLARTSVQRIYDMIMSHGTSVDDDGKTHYNFFRNKMFGAEEQIEQIMDYFRAASMGLDIKKRVLLLLGPPGGGKSMFLTMLKKGMAKYTKSEKGSLYKIRSCPINEDPLHLIEDEDVRKELWDNYNIKIEGKLCPHCKHMLESDWKNNLTEVQVERFYIDEETRKGVGTFAPAEENDMSELYGSINVRKIAEYGDESDPRTFDFTGELQKANRGIMEFIEILKANPAFLHVLLTLAEEQQFKTPRFPLIYVDEALIAHTNEGEFLRFISVKENEAVIDRLFIVRMPYNMDYRNEELIYHSALKTKLVVEGVKVHPGAIRLASAFAITTRFAEKDDKGNRDKLRDGMHGISPRFILNALAISMSKLPEGESLVTPKEMYRILRYQLENYPILSKEKRREYIGNLDLYYEKYKEKLDVMTMSDVRTDQLNPRGRSGFGLF